MSVVPVTRRRFLEVTALAAGGLLVGFHVPAEAASIQPEPWTALPQGAEINAWLAIDAEGNVTIRVPHTEMGQGALTSVSMMIAEELNVDWARVRAVFADPNRHLRNNNEYTTMFTAGSALVRHQHPHIMQAGASARERLKEAAARAWGVDRSRVEARLGKLESGARSGTYAEFATAAAAIALSEEPAIKTPDQWWLLGKSLHRLDVDVKSNGSAVYAIDAQLPGMVYAAVKACPVPWGRLARFDDRAIRSRPGIVAVTALEAAPGKKGNSDLQDAVAVVADSWWRAKTALDQLPIEWDTGSAASVSTASQQAEAKRLLDRPGEAVSEGEGTLAAIAAAEKVVTAEYQRPWETHARMEPINATASVAAGRVDVWSPTQDQSVALQLAADQAGTSTKNVFVHTVFLGGGFGGNGAGGTAVTRQAVELSKRLARPVKVIWSREEDIAQDKQRPPNVTRLSAALGERGLPTAWFTRSVWFTQDGIDRVGPATADYAISNMPYQVPNRRHERINAKAHIPVATHRAPGTNQHGFMTECFVDEVALAGGWDPLEWRLELTKGLADWQLVLRTLKDKAGFRTDLPRGHGMGVAIVEDHGSICAACATVRVSRAGELAVEKVVVVIDSGHVINPHNAAEQLEGGVCWELSHAWMGGLELREGRFVNTNFDGYPLLRMPQMPTVEVHFALSGGKKWGGIGEPAGPPVPPAVANAIWFATGKRIRSTPFKSHDLSWG
ncbi:MAG TPA: molybdopterin cofactor-binding domain-containing protein [Myxococcota bacterium]|nr:molybdopterin cofactor-binding domain-containing protein [Myxococcota bacterium]